MQNALRDFYTKLNAEHDYSAMLGLAVNWLHPCSKSSEIYMTFILNTIKNFLWSNWVLFWSQSCGFWDCLVLWMDANVSEEYTASMFRFEESGTRKSGQVTQAERQGWRSVITMGQAITSWKWPFLHLTFIPQLFRGHITHISCVQCDGSHLEIIN
jgi:hypothetical protein